MVKNSLIFSLYNKNLKRNELYTKTNNSIKGFYTDNILNDSVYFASNGIKKNSIFRKNEININHKNFVSFFSSIEDDFSVFNIYPQKYFSNLMNEHLNKQKTITNYIRKTTNKNKINSLFLDNYRSLNTSTDITSFQERSSKKLFIKNYFDKCYFIDGNGFISKLDNRLFSKQLFSGLLYVLPPKIQAQLKNLLLLNYLLLNFFSNIKAKNYKNDILKYNVILYNFFFKYLNNSVKTYFSINNIKIRKSNWLLYKFTKIYINPINKLINYYFHIQFKNTKNLEVTNVISNFLINKNNNVSNIKNLLNLNNIEPLTKINIINILLKQIYVQYPYKATSFNTSNILYKYIESKALLIQYLFRNKVDLFNFNFPSFYNYSNLLNSQIKNIFNNNYANDNYLVNYNDIFKINTSNNDQFNFVLSRNFLNLLDLKQYLNFDKKIIVNKYSPSISSRDLNILKKHFNKLKRSSSKNKRNLKKNFQNNQYFSTLQRNLKFRQLKYPWLKFYNLANYKKMMINKLYKIK